MADPKRVVLDENENQIPEEMSGFLGYGTSDPNPPEYEMDRNQLNWLQQSVMNFYENENIDPGVRSALAALDDWMPGIPFHDFVPDPPTSLPGGASNLTIGDYVTADESRAGLGKILAVADAGGLAVGAYKGAKYIKGAYTEAGSINVALNNALQQVKNWGSAKLNQFDKIPGSLDDEFRRVASDIRQRKDSDLIDLNDPTLDPFIIQNQHTLIDRGSLRPVELADGRILYRVTPRENITTPVVSRHDSSDPNANWASLDNSRTGFLPPYAGQGYPQTPIYGRDYAGGKFKRIDNSGDLYMSGIDDGTVAIDPSVYSGIDLNNLRPAYEMDNGFIIYQDITDNRRFYSLELKPDGTYTLADDTYELENRFGNLDEMVSNSPAVPSNIKGMQDSFANSMNPNTLSELDLSELNNLPRGQELVGTLESGTKVILKNGDEVAGQKMFEDANNITIQTRDGQIVNIDTMNAKEIKRNTKGNPLTVKIKGQGSGIFNVTLDDKHSDVVRVGQEMGGEILTGGSQGSRLRFQATRLPDGQLEISHISLFADSIGSATADVPRGLYKMPDGTDFNVIADSQLHTRFTTETGELRQITRIEDNDTGQLLKEIITPGGRAAERLIARTSLSGGKSLVKMMDMMPDDAIIREADMTLDSLYVLIHQTVKKSQARVKAGKSPLNIDISGWQPRGSGKQSSQSATFMFGNERIARSNWSKQFDKIMNMPPGAEQHQAQLDLVVEIQQKINKAIASGDLTSTHGNLFEVVAGTSANRPSYGGQAIGYSQFSVSGFKSIVAGLFGYSTWDEYSSMLKDENTNNVENQVFDQIQF